MYLFEIFARNKSDFAKRYGKAADVKKFKNTLENLEYGIEKAQIFVIDKTLPTTCLPDVEGCKEAVRSLPFEVCSFEFLEGYIEISGDNGASTQVGAIMVQRTEDDDLIIFVNTEEGRIIPIDIESLSGVHDIPGHSISERSRKVVILIYSILSSIQQRDYSEGKITNKRKISYKKNKNRRIGDVIYITSKKKQERSPSLKSIDFSHRFMRMGHWRKIRGIGKDSLGNRNQKNRTWVVDCEVGSPNLPMVKKMRIVK